MASSDLLAPLDRLVGMWTTEATHPKVPGVVVRGRTVMEWLDGRRFLIQRAHVDHPDFPDAISVIGVTTHDRVEAETGAEQLQMHYFDSRGVFRLLDVTIDARTWRMERLAPGFSQRFAGALSDDGRTIEGVWQLRRDDGHWADDLRITYRRS